MRKFFISLIIFCVSVFCCCFLIVECVNGAETLKITQDQFEFREEPRVAEETLLGTLRVGTPVEWTGETSGNWFEVLAPNGQIGWVHQSGLSAPKSPPKPTPKPQPKSTPQPESERSRSVPKTSSNDLQKKISELEKMNTQYQAQLEDKNGRIIELSGDLKDLEQKLVETSQSLDDTKQVHEREKLRVEELKEALGQKENELLAGKKEVTELQNQLTDLQGQTGVEHLLAYLNIIWVVLLGIVGLLYVRQKKHEKSTIEADIGEHKNYIISKQYASSGLPKADTLPVVEQEEIQPKQPGMPKVGEPAMVMTAGPGQEIVMPEEENFEGEEVIIELSDVLPDQGGQSGEAEPVEEIQDVEIITEELEEVEEIEDLEEVEEVEEIEDLEEVEEVEEILEVEEIEDVEELGELEEVGEIKEIKNIEAIEEIAELEALEDVEELGELEEVGEIKEIKNIEAIEEIAELEALEDVEEPGELEEVEEVKEIEKIEEIGAIAELEALEDVEEPGELKEIGEVEEIEDFEGGGAIEGTAHPLAEELKEILEKEEEGGGEEAEDFDYDFEEIYAESMMEDSSEETSGFVEEEKTEEGVTTVEIDGEKFEMLVEQSTQIIEPEEDHDALLAGSGYKRSAKEAESIEEVDAIEIEELEKTVEEMEVEDVEEIETGEEDIFEEMEVEDIGELEEVEEDVFEEVEVEDVGGLEEVEEIIEVFEVVEEVESDEGKSGMMVDQSTQSGEFGALEQSAVPILLEPSPILIEPEYEPAEPSFAKDRESVSPPLKSEGPRYDIELVNVGEHKEQILHILSKIEGLSKSPQELIDVVPSIIVHGAKERDAKNFQVVMQKLGSAVRLIRK